MANEILFPKNEKMRILISFHRKEIKNKNYYRSHLLVYRDWHFDKNRFIEIVSLRQYTDDMANSNKRNTLKFYTDLIETC